MENVWEYLCGNKLRAVVRDTDDAIVAPWRQAWTFLTDDPDRVRSIGTRDWASVNGQDGWYQGNRVNEQVTNRESSESMAPLDSRRGYQPWPTQQRLARRSPKPSFF